MTHQGTGTPAAGMFWGKPSLVDSWRTTHNLTHSLGSVMIKQLGPLLQKGLYFSLLWWLGLCPIVYFCPFVILSITIKVTSWGRKRWKFAENFTNPQNVASLCCLFPPCALLFSGKNLWNWFQFWHMVLFQFVNLELGIEKSQGNLGPTKDSLRLFRRFFP